MDEDDRDDFAYGVIEDFLREGPEYLTIVEGLADEGFEDFTDEDTDYIESLITRTLGHIAERFNLIYKEEA